MEDDDESWRDIDPHPMFPAAIYRQTPKVKRVKVEPDIKVEPDTEVQGLKAERNPEASSPPSSEDSCPPSPEASCSSSSEASHPPSPEASCPPSPAASCSSSSEASHPPSPEASCPPSPAASCSSPPEVSCPSSPEESHASSPEPPEIKVEEAEDEATPEASCPSSPESSCPSLPEPPETTTEVTPEPKCRCCKETAVLRYTSYLNEINVGRPYYVCPNIERWVCWADQEGIDAVNPSCDCKGEVPSRLDIIIRKKEKFGRGFWTCAKGQCDFYSENEDGKPGVSFDGGFYPRFRDGKRKRCD